MGKCCSKRQEPQNKGYKTAEIGLHSADVNGGSLNRYSADPNQQLQQRVIQSRADIIRARPIPRKLQKQELMHVIAASAGFTITALELKLGAWHQFRKLIQH